LYNNIIALVYLLVDLCMLSIYLDVHLVSYISYCMQLYKLLKTIISRLCLKNLKLGQASNAEAHLKLYVSIADAGYVIT